MLEPLPSSTMRGLAPSERTNEGAFAQDRGFGAREDSTRAACRCGRTAPSRARIVEKFRMQAPGRFLKAGEDFLEQYAVGVLGFSIELARHRAVSFSVLCEADSETASACEGRRSCGTWRARPRAWQSSRRAGPSGSP